MNIDTLAGEGTSIKGRFKESLGDAAGDSVLERDGIADQVSGEIRKSFGSLRDFARDKPFAALLAGVVGVALIGSLGRSRTRSSRARR
jgi:uncharacterized protein YjbJ (UPF0337 family)